MDGFRCLEVCLHSRWSPSCRHFVGSLYKKMKRAPNKISFRNNAKSRNVWLFDAGLHTLHLKMKDGEADMEFVERFLIQFLDGCRSRGGKKYKYFFLDHESGDNYISVRGVK